MRFPLFLGSGSVQRLVQRVGVAFVFVSFGLWEIIDPALWTGFVPEFMQVFASSELLVLFHGLALLLVGLGILGGFYVRFFAFIGVLMMLEVIVSLALQSGFTSILVRDIGVLFLVVTLLFDPFGEKLND